MDKQALLVVDVQVGLFSTPRFDAENLIIRLNGIAGRLRERGAPVIFVQHCGPQGDPLHPSQPGHALHKDLVIEADDMRVTKESFDALLNTTLASRKDSQFSQIVRNLKPHKHEIKFHRSRRRAGRFGGLQYHAKRSDFVSEYFKSGLKSLRKHLSFFLVADCHQR